PQIAFLVGLPGERAGRGGSELRTRIPVWKRADDVEIQLRVGVNRDIVAHAAGAPGRFELAFELEVLLSAVHPVNPGSLRRVVRDPKRSVRLGLESLELVE